MWYAVKSKNVKKANIIIPKKKTGISYDTRMLNYVHAANYLDKIGMVQISNALDIRLSEIIKTANDYEYEPWEYRVDPDTNKWMQQYQNIFGKPYNEYGDRSETYSVADLERVIRNPGFMSHERIKPLTPHLNDIDPYELNYLLSKNSNGINPNDPNLSNEALRQKLQFLQEQGLTRGSDDYIRALQFYGLSPLHKRIPYNQIKHVFDLEKLSPAVRAVSGLNSVNFNQPLSQEAAKMLFFDSPEQAEKNPLKGIDLPNRNFSKKYFYENSDDIETQYQKEKEIMQRVTNNPELWKNYSFKTVRDIAKDYDPETDRNKNDETLIAETFLSNKVDKQVFIEQLSNNIERIYRIDQSNPIFKSLLLFLSSHPNSLGASIHAILKAIELEKLDLPNIAPHLFHGDMDRVVSIFGKNIDQWLQKFKKNKNEGTNIHAASQMLPSGTVRELAGLGQFLLNNFNKMSMEDLTSVANTWKTLTPEEKQLLPNELVDTILTKNLSDILDGSEVHSMPFAKETARWWQTDEGDEPDDEDDDDENDYADYYNDSQEDVSYEELENVYLNSLNVPLPEWASASASAGGLVGHFLPRSDVRGLYLGQYSNSCQHPWNVGSECAYHGQSSPNGAFFVVEDGKKNIVAQSWVWQDAHGNVVFDNVEAKGIGPVRMPYVRKIYEDVAKQMKGRIVNMGIGLTDLDIHGLPNASVLLKPADYEGYSDADKQVQLANNTIANA